MIGPFALFFGIKPWQLRDPALLTHDEFLGLEALARELLARKQGGGTHG